MYSVDFRSLAVRLYRELRSFRKVAALLQTAHSTVHRWVHHPQMPIQRRSRNTVIDRPLVLETVRAFLQRSLLSTVANVRHHIQLHCGVSLSPELARLAVRKANMSCKKPRFFGGAAAVGNDPRTQLFLERRAALLRRRGLRLVSIDETGFSNNVTPLRGYAPIGQRLILTRPNVVPGNRHVSVVACVERSTGRCRHVAHQGYINQQRFCAFLESLPYGRNTVLLLDNVRFHHSIGVQQLFRRRGWLPLYVPPYSPWFNPIENVFSLVKRAFRNGAPIDAACDAAPQVAVRRAFERALRLDATPLS